MALEAWQNMLSVIGGAYKERWPEEESRIIFDTDVFTYTQRITALTFLYGNLRDAALVYAALQPQIGVDPRDQDHAHRFLVDLASSKYDQKYHYFDVLPPTGCSSTAQCTRAAHRPASSRACCLRGSDIARACDGWRRVGRRLLSSALS